MAASVSGVSEKFSINSECTIVPFGTWGGGCRGGWLLVETSTSALHAERTSRRRAIRVRGRA